MADNFLLDPQKGNFGFHKALGWIRSSSGMDLAIFGNPNDFDDQVVFLVPEAVSNRVYQFSLTFKQIQNLHSFGGTFEGFLALDVALGTEGNFTAIETINGTSIVGKDGEQVFPTGVNRRVDTSFKHDGTHVYKTGTYEGTPDIFFNGTDTVEVINEQGETVTNTVPLIIPGEYFNYMTNVTDGLDKTMYLYVNGILVNNPTFSLNTGGVAGNRLVYQAGSGGGLRQSYIRQFGATINTPTLWVLNNTDIISALTTLADFTEKADEGGTDFITCSKLSDLVDTDIIGAAICFLSGANIGSETTITAYNKVTGKIEFNPVLINNNTTVFGIVLQSYQSYIDRAYYIIENDLRNKGLKIELFLNLTHVKELHLTKTLELICLSKRQDADSDDSYHEAYLEFKERYASDLDNMKADYDVNEDGAIADYTIKVKVNEFGDILRDSFGKPIEADENCVAYPAGDCVEIAVSELASTQTTTLGTSQVWLG